MKLLDIIPLRISLFSVIYVLLLIFIAPFIDHLFTSLEEDKILKENNFQILFEIIVHLIVISVIWYLLNTYLVLILEKLLNIKIKEATKTTVGIVGSIALVGLQKNLIDKLKYISYEHPFRMKDLYNF
ncbi:MAG: hypothetical protein CMG26_07430 [Candidatus Marinimicrobia bacterium]|nr:hypothetical protein [Candidatus Neomarinimicrobiota bacterium]